MDLVVEMAVIICTLITFCVFILRKPKNKSIELPAFRWVNGTDEVQMIPKKELPAFRWVKGTDEVQMIPQKDIVVSRAGKNNEIVVVSVSDDVKKEIKEVEAKERKKRKISREEAKELAAAYVLRYKEKARKKSETNSNLNNNSNGIISQNKVVNQNSDQLPLGKLKDSLNRLYTEYKKIKNNFECLYKDEIGLKRSYVPLNFENKDGIRNSNIQASFIEDKDGNRRNYIALGSIVDEDIEGFWQLVWHYGVLTIALFNDMNYINNKDDTDKPEQNNKFMPDFKGNKKQEWGNIQVSIVRTIANSIYIIKEVTLKNSQFPDKERNINVITFHSWKKNKLPANSFTLLAFRNIVNHLNKNSKGSLVVMSSDGIGRAGVFIATDILIKLYEENRYAPVYDCVNNLRIQRKYMVPALKQYKIIFNIMEEGLVFDYEGIRKDEYESFLIYNYASYSTEVFKALDNFRNFDRPSYGNMFKSNHRYPNTIAHDHCRVQIDYVEYINAVYMDTYEIKNGYILAEHPMNDEASMLSFLLMLFKCKPRFVIMLEDVNKSKELNLGKYWENKEYIIEEKSASYEQFNIKKLTIKQMKNLHDHVQFDLISLNTEKWHAKSAVPIDFTTLPMLYNFIGNNNSLKEKILIHCADGSSKCGLFAAMSMMLDILKIEQKINIPIACRYVMDVRPAAFRKNEEVKYLFNLAKQFIKDSCKINDQLDHVFKPFINNAN